MIYTVKIDDKTPTGKRIINDLRKHPKTVIFEDPEVTGVIPEGYVTGDEFESQVKENINSYCKNNGII
jgi:hypothetical protein